MLVGEDANQGQSVWDLQLHQSHLNISLYVENIGWRNLVGEDANQGQIPNFHY